jgi:hypothetical protein
MSARLERKRIDISDLHPTLSGPETQARYGTLIPDQFRQ